MTTEPHVILMLGPHLAGASLEMENVIKTEKPVALALEGEGTEEIHAQLRRRLETEAETLERHRDPRIAFVAESFLLAKRNGLRFHPAEIHSEETLARIIEKTRHSYSCFDRSMDHAHSGELEKSIEAYKEGIASIQQATEERNGIIADRVASIARGAGGPVALFLGTAHDKTVKKLLQKGIKVTLYRVKEKHLLSPTLPSNPLKGIWEGLIATYIQDRYGIWPGDLPETLHLVENGVRLKRIPAEQVDALIRSVKSKIQFRVAFLKLCKEHGVIFPDPSEFHQRVRGGRYPSFRKVKTFQPEER